MNKEIAKKWVEALRSGKYKQTKYKLRNNDIDNHKSMCCLGVLCDLYQKETGKGEWINDGNSNYIFQSTRGGSKEVLPTPVANWADMRSVNGSFSFLPAGTGEECLEVNEECLEVKNDDGATFEEIAELIEKKVNLL